MIVRVIDNSQQLRRIDFAVATAGDAPNLGVVADMGESRLIDMLRAGRAEWTGAWAFVAQDGLSVHRADLLAVFKPWADFRHCFPPWGIRRKSSKSGRR